MTEEDFIEKLFTEDFDIQGLVVEKMPMKGWLNVSFNIRFEQPFEHFIAPGGEA